MPTRALSFAVDLWSSPIVEHDLEPDSSGPYLFGYFFVEGPDFIPFIHIWLDLAFDIVLLLVFSVLNIITPTLSVLFPLVTPMMALVPTPTIPTNTLIKTPWILK